MRETRTGRLGSISVYPNFYRLLPLKSQFKLYAAIFFMFTPVGLLWVSSFAEQHPWKLIVAALLFGGVIGVAYAFSFMRETKYRLLVVPFHVIVAALMGWQFGFETFRLRFEGAGCGLLIALGFIFFVNFINGEGARSLRLQTDVALAQRLHTKLVPAVVESTPVLELYGKSVASSEVGGDLLDVYRNNDHLTLSVADVSGHGVRAALLMGMMKSALRMKLLASHGLDSLFNDLNQVLFQVKDRDMFVTFACLQFGGSGSASYCVAGHPPILHYQSESGILRHLSTKHVALGFLRDYRYRAETVTFGAGDLFVVLTDGFTEVMSGSGQVFGTERIENLVSENVDRPLAEIHASIVNAVQGYGAQMDDQTLLLARVRST